MTGKRLWQLEHGYLQALNVVEFYRLQGMEGFIVSVGQFAACEGLDWNEYEELKEHLEKRGINGHE